MRRLFSIFDGLLRRNVNQLGDIIGPVLRLACNFLDRLGRRLLDLIAPRRAHRLLSRLCWLLRGIGGLLRNGAIAGTPSGKGADEVPQRLTSNRQNHCPIALMDTNCMATVITPPTNRAAITSSTITMTSPGPIATKELMMCAARSYL